MLLAAMLAMTLAASSPAFAQQTSGPATDAEGAGNVCVQQLQNVNSGNVDQDQTAVNDNAQIGAIQDAAAAADRGGVAVALNIAIVDQIQDVVQSITQSQEGIEQQNNALQICNQTLNR